MGQVQYVRSDRGASGGGYVAVLGALAVVGLLAWWGLTTMGVLGEPAPSATVPGDSPTTGLAPDLGQPAWLQGSSQTLPPLLSIDHERPAHLMSSWVWDFVDDSWNLVTHPGVTEDGAPSLTLGQVLYLADPDERLFRLWPLRNDHVVEVVRWDRNLAVAWLARTGGSGLTPVVQFDLKAGSQQESWGAGAIPAANSLSRGIGNLAPVGVTGSGGELWVGYTNAGRITGLMWRNGTSFQRSVITDEIRRLDLQGYTVDKGVDAWIDLSRDLAFYRAPFKIDGRLDREIWIRHDLRTDDFETISPDLPRGGDCEPATDVFTGDQFDGNLLVAMCRVAGTTSTTFIAP